jgi:DNA-binding transcriptional LysR family regulator
VLQLHRFQERCPDIDVRISATDEVVDLTRRDFDPAIRCGLGRYPGLTVELLMQNEVFPACSPQLLKSGPPLNSPDDLRHHALIHGPGRAAVSGCPSVGSRISDVTLPLSRFVRDTRSGRNPDHAGGGPTGGASPGLPVAAPPLRSRSSSASKEARQPVLSARMRNALSSSLLG